MVPSSFVSKVPSTMGFGGGGGGAVDGADGTDKRCFLPGEVGLLIELLELLELLGLLDPGPGVRTRPPVLRKELHGGVRRTPPAATSRGLVLHLLEGLFSASVSRRVLKSSPAIQV